MLIYSFLPFIRQPPFCPMEPLASGDLVLIPPFSKGGSGGILSAWEKSKIPLNPPLKKGDFKSCPPFSLFDIGELHRYSYILSRTPSIFLSASRWENLPCIDY